MMKMKDEKLNEIKRATLARGLRNRWGSEKRCASKQIRIDADALTAFAAVVPESRRREVATAAIWRVVSDFGGIPLPVPEDAAAKLKEEARRD